MMPIYRTTDLSTLEKAKHPIVDLRSDTVSRPTEEMRKAMYEAVVGDDVYGEDPTVNKLQEKVAKLFCKEASIFLPTGTMGNLIAILAHSDRRGCEIISGDEAHTFLYEQGGPAQIGGVHTRTVPNLPDGTFDLNHLEKCIRGNDLHSPITSLIIVENTHNMCGGKVIPLKWLDELAALAQKYKIPLHMDGARIFNAAVYLNVPVSKIVQKIDSVQFCFSKGLGCPVGSMLVGSKELIMKAKRLRKVLGAGMRQAGVIAAPCIVALDKMVDRLAEDHRRTREIAKAIHDLDVDFIKVDLEGLHTNILMLYFNTPKLTATEFCGRLVTVTDDEETELKDDAVIVRLFPKNEKTTRLVVYHEITDEDVRRVIRKIRYIAKEVLRSGKNQNHNGNISC
ncbi:UNVERIFIED_CONTAM: hypothetical protein PYX00_000966 [Menopon gallinae]